MLLHLCACIFFHSHTHSHAINVIQFLNKLTLFFIIAFGYLLVYRWVFGVYPIWLHSPGTLNLDLLLPQFPECRVLGMCNHGRTLGITFKDILQSLIYSRLVSTLSKDDLDFCVLLPLLPKYRDDKCIYTVIYEVLGIEPRGPHAC